MPTYDMECRDCGHRLERYCPMLERNKQHCPLCHGVMGVLISAPAAAHVWQPSWWYLGSKDKVFIRSKSQLFEECKKRGKFSVGYDQENSLPDRPIPDGGLKTRDEVVKQEAAFWDTKLPEDDG